MKKVLGIFALLVVLFIAVFDIYLLINIGGYYYKEVEVYDYNGHEVYIKVDNDRYDKRNLNVKELDIYCIDCIFLTFNDLDEVGEYWRDDIYELDGKYYIRFSIF